MRAVVQAFEKSGEERRVVAARVRKEMHDVEWDGEWEEEAWDLGGDSKAVNPVLLGEAVLLPFSGGGFHFSGALHPVFVRPKVVGEVVDGDIRRWVVDVGRSRDGDVVAFVRGLLDPNPFDTAITARMNSTLVLTPCVCLSAGWDIAARKWAERAELEICICHGVIGINAQCSSCKLLNYQVCEGIVILRFLGDYADAEILGVSESHGRAEVVIDEEDRPSAVFSATEEVEAVGACREEDVGRVVEVAACGIWRDAVDGDRCGAKLLVDSGISDVVHGSIIRVRVVELVE